MMGEALRVAITHYALPVCNPHSAQVSQLAPVLWLFYVSKVRRRGGMGQRAAATVS